MHLVESRILCVDDDPATSDFIRKEFRISNISSLVRSAGGGREALKLLKNEAFDLCVLNGLLPDMKGVQLCSLMRQIGYSVPVMFFGVPDRPIDREQAAAAGADKYLCKPGDLKMFMDAAADLLHIDIQPVVCTEIQGLADGAFGS